MNKQIYYSSFEKKLFLGVAIFSVAILAFGIFFINKSSTEAPVATKEESKKILAVSNDDWIKGQPNSPVTVVEYLDFECEACRIYYPITKRLKEEYRDKVSFIVRYFPLPGHKNSMTSAMAVETAGKQGKFWEMHDKLYDTQKDWGEKQVADPSIFVEYAKQIGLDMERYKSDISTQEIKDRINRDKDSAIRLGIQGTPTFFINGEKIPNPKGYEDFKSLIDGLTPQVK